MSTPKTPTKLKMPKPPKNPKWLQINEMIQDYENGMNLREIAKKYEVGHGALRHQFAKAGGKTRTRSEREAVKHAEVRSLKPRIIHRYLEDNLGPQEIIIRDFKVNAGLTFIHDTLYEAGVMRSHEEAMKVRYEQTWAKKRMTKLKDIDDIVEKE